MEEKINEEKNPYKNELALNELLKMMKRKERLTVTFAIDKYGYETAEIESRPIEKFKLQLSDTLLNWIIEYLNNGEIIEPIPPHDKDLIISQFTDTNALATDLLKQFLQRTFYRTRIHLVPEVIDKPGRLTCTLQYQFGIIIFKIKREKEIMDLLEVEGF